MRIREIYDDLINEATTMPELSGLMPSGTASDYASQSLIEQLSSSSKVAIWRLILWVVAVYAYAIEQLMADHTASVTAAAEAAIPGNDAWLCAEAKRFELGNSSIAVTAAKKVVYVVPQPSSKIITYAAVSRLRGRALLKVAKGTTSPVPLDNAELVSFSTWMNHVRFAGTQLAIISLPADQLKFTGTVYYNGLAPLAVVKAAVLEKLSAYLMAMPFDGFLSLELLTDVIQSVPEVKDLTVNWFARRHDLGYSAIPVSGKGYATAAGYAVFDVVSLDSSDITWTAV